MVGSIIGVFVGVEAKGSNRRGEKDGGCSPMQVIRLREINDAGGLGIVIYGPEDLKHLDYNLTGQGLQWAHPPKGVTGRG